MLSPYCGMWVGIVDGHEQTTSKYHKCSHCKSRIVTKKGGVKEVQYYHEFTAFILAGPDISFILDIEPYFQVRERFQAQTGFLEGYVGIIPRHFP